MDEQSILSIQNKREGKYLMCHVENLNELMINYKTYNLSRSDIHLFIHLCLEASNSSLSVKIKTSWLSSVFGTSEGTLYNSIIRLRAADLIRQREHSFMINPAYIRFGRKQLRALQCVLWAKIKPHSKSETHSIEVIKKLKKDIHL